jgi:hypothetical protein
MFGCRVGTPWSTRAWQPLHGAVRLGSKHTNSWRQRSQPACGQRRLVGQQQRSGCGSSPQHHELADAVRHLWRQPLVVHHLAAHRLPRLLVQLVDGRADGPAGGREGRGGGSRGWSAPRANGAAAAAGAARAAASTMASSSEQQASAQPSQAHLYFCGGTPAMASMASSSRLWFSLTVNSPRPRSPRISVSTCGTGSGMDGQVGPAACWPQVAACLGSRLAPSGSQLAPSGSRLARSGKQLQPRALTLSTSASATMGAYAPATSKSHWKNSLRRSRERQATGSVRRHS